MALLLWVSSLAEPEYKGVKLSVWLERYHNEVNAEPQRMETVDAIRQIGSNAVPTLISWLSASDSKLKIKLMDLAEKQSFIKFKITLAMEYHDRALLGFELLGQQAKSAIPELEKLLYRPKATTYATLALCCFGENAIPVFVRALTNTDLEVKQSLAFAIYEHYYDEELVESPESRMLLPVSLPVPLLLTLLEDPNYQVRVVAIRQIGDAAHQGVIQPLTAVPLLIKELKVLHFRYFNEAAAALATIGPDAQDAIPALLDILAEASKTADRESGANALGTLRALKAKPSEVVPLLERYLKTHDADTRRWAIDSLKKYGPDAKNAVPAILNAAATDESLRPAAVRALKSIDPEAAAKAIAK